MAIPRERFTSRVEDYVRYRPGYPGDALRDARRPGTSRRRFRGGRRGIGHRHPLARPPGVGGARVVGIEPNAAMRAAAEKDLAAHPRFESVDASAEATGLPDASADLVVAGQAFHWFDPARARAEFARILRPAGLVALVWNQRRDSPQNREYIEMLERFAPDYALVRESERSSEPKMRAFFAPASPRMAVFENEQRLDEAGYIGRLLSSSYAPPAGHPAHAPMLARAAEIFRAHAHGRPRDHPLRHGRLVRRAGVIPRETARTPRTPGQRDWGARRTTRRNGSKSRR